jgi:hypothetical protein
MAKSLPALAGDFLNTRHMWLVSSDSDLFEKEAVPLDYCMPDAERQEAAEEGANIIGRLAEALAHLDADQPPLDLADYFGLSEFHISVLCEQTRSGRETRLKLDADLLVPSFREAERYWAWEYHRAYHAAYPDPAIIARWNRFFTGHPVQLMERSGRQYLVSAQGETDCQEWREILETFIAPTMAEKLERARVTIGAISSRLFERGDVDFLICGCALDERMVQSIRRDFHGTVREFVAALPNLFDPDLFARLEAYPTLTMEKTFIFA